MHDIELHAEVEKWLDGLSAPHFARVEALAGRLAENPGTPGLNARLIRGEAWELKFRLSGDAWRLTYWVNGGRCIFLTVIRKTQDCQQGDLERAVREQATCARSHDRAVREYGR